MFVYLISNKINNKKYVGITRRKFETRISQHKNTHKQKERYKSYLHRAMRKYGWEEFEFKIIEELKQRDLNALKDRERFWIKELNTFVPNGYNMTEGGDGMGKRIIREETREKLRKAHLLRFSDPKEREKTSIATKKAMVNFTHTPEMRKKMSDAHKGNQYTLGIKRSKKSIEKQRVSAIENGIIGKYKRTKQMTQMATETKKKNKSSVYGPNNPMNNEEYRKKVGQSKIGRKRFYRNDGSFFMAYPDNPIDPRNK